MKKKLTIMKKIFVFSVLFFIFLSVQAQQTEKFETPATQLAHKIADKMKDSLGLTNQQRAKIFTINMDLHKQKTEARARPQDRTAVGNELQKIESTRDAMYRTILTDDQYAIYQQKKRYLVSSN